MAITGSLDLSLTMAVFLEQVAARLAVDATDVLLFERGTQTLAYAAGRGFRTAEFRKTRLRIGQGRAGQAALERRVVVATGPSIMAAPSQRTALLVREDFVSYYGVPLIAKGEVLGVLEIFNRTPLQPDPEWLEFLEALAGQAAIAIENASLFEGLQRSNLELGRAYELTIEGWSAALDLRDKETEGHSQRVTLMTIELAQKLGVVSEELVHIQRGALLHDIGKMGVPDHILLKPGPLTDEEWVLMRQHPVFAYRLLQPIQYLRPALDIPYCHHEKWDGTGYPRRLAGDAIPLAARIFTVVDVWDALRSDRPYRQAWPADKVTEYIRQHAGRSFDPQVVESFLAIISASPLPV
jgi:putative nucleotidyltransferase with HDIG domain